MKARGGFFGAIVGTGCSAFVAGVALVGCVAGAVGSALAAPRLGEIVVGLDTRPRAFDPRMIGGDANSFYLEELRFLPLVSSNPDGTPKFVVAQKIVPKGKANWKVTLRSGIQFALGRELTADDVVGTYESILQVKPHFPPSTRKGDFAHVSSIKKLSNREVLFTLSKADAAFPSNLVVGILPREALSEKPGTLIGKGFESGPFVLQNATDLRVHLTANEKYSAAAFGLPKPHLKHVVFQTYSDSNTLYSALIKGDVQLVQNALDSDKAQALKQNPKADFKVQTRAATNTMYFSFNLKDARFQNKKFRKAFSLAINRDEIIKYVLAGFAIPARGMFPPGFTFYEPKLSAPEFNTEKAKKLLDEAGYPDPDQAGPLPRLEFTLKVTTAGDRLKIARAVAAQLKNVGIEVRVEALEFGTFYNQIDTGRVDAWISPWIGYKDPDLLRFAFSTSQQTPVGGNLNSFSNAKIDALLEAGKQEFQLNKRLKKYSAAQLLLEEEIPYIYLWHKSCVAVLQSSFSGYSVHANGSFWGLTEVKPVK